MYDNWPTFYNQIISDIDNEVNQAGGLFYIENQVSGIVNSLQNIYKNCFNSLVGAIFYAPMKI